MPSPWKNLDCKHFSNELGFSVESSLQYTSSILLLWRRKPFVGSTVLYTWFWRGKPAASVRAELSFFLWFAFQSPTRTLAAGLPRQNHVYSTTDKAGLDFVRNGRAIQWNPVYKAFHWIRPGLCQLLTNLVPNTGLNRKSALRSSILFASTELTHRSRSDSPLLFNIKNTCQIHTEK